MSEFEKLEGDAQKFAQDHPEQVQKGEQAVENKLGLSQQDSDSQQADGTQAAGDQGNGLDQEQDSADSAQ
jgi:hypothetical protein